MPGKVNPVLPMAMIQLGFAVIGNDTCIAQATQPASWKSITSNR